MVSVVLAIVLMFGGVATVPAGDDPANCKPPAWAPTALPGYQLDSCVDKAWDVTDVETTTGEKKVEGERVDIVYRRIDDSHNASNMTAWRYFVAAAEKAGATLMSDKGGGFQAYLERKTATGDQWFAYIHGSGNDESTGSFTLETLIVKPLPQEVTAKLDETPWNTAACSDPPWLVRQFSYFKRGECNDRDFDSFTFDTADGEKTVAGRVLEVKYELTDDTKDPPTPVAVYRNYVAALKAIGATQVSRPGETNHAVFKQTTPKGEYWYMYAQAGGNEDNEPAYTLIAVEHATPPTTQCKLEVYGVNFDTDKSDLRPDAEPVLEQLLALFKSDPAYAAEIGGHTDDVGDDAHNMKLSQDRANAVKSWLVAHGVGATRVTTAGFGKTRPLVPNSSDENRAKNRRVELTKKNCGT